VVKGTAQEGTHRVQGGLSFSLCLFCLILFPSGQQHLFIEVQLQQQCHARDLCPATMLMLLHCLTTLIDDPN